ncbi:MAG: winged helix-turn-helix transcriptional regulator [Thermoplasmatota archaeon]
MIDFFDEVDFEILRELWVGSGTYFRSDRVSLDAVARALGLHRSTVAARLAKWKRSGALVAFTIDVDPTAIALVGTHTQFRVGAEDHEEAIARAARVPGVPAVLAFADRWVGVPLFARSSAETERRIAELARIFEASEVVRVSDTRVDFRDARAVPLDALDARLLGLLIGDSRQSPRALARSAGASLRTVERHLARLRRESVYYVLPQVDFGRVRGIIAAYVFFGLPEAPRRTSVLRQALSKVPRIFNRQIEAPRVARLGLYAPTLRELERDVDAIRKVPGVSDVRVRLYTGLRTDAGFAKWILEKIEERVE